MISFLALAAVVTGAMLLVGALFTVRKLIAKLPTGTLRMRWNGLSGLIALFVAGYLAYLVLFHDRHGVVLDLVVPGIFLLGACFVLLTAILSYQTTLDVIRVSLLEREAFTDPLTGLYNRRYLNRRLSEEVAVARRYGRSLSLLLLDFDHFKEVNDRHGHQAGDQVLVRAAQVISGGLRETDVFARFGGEEFMIVASHTALEGAVGLAERLRARLESEEFQVGTLEGTVRIRVTASFGVVSYGEGRDSVELLVRGADESLYAAKGAGRNRVVAVEDAGTAVVRAKPAS